MAINPTNQAMSAQNQRLLLNNQNRLLQLTSRYIGELETQPATMESAQILTNLSMASNLSSNYVDYTA